MQAKKYLIVVGGPTASGKTSTAIALAKHFNTVVLSADSRQFYREMSIGTAKPDPIELAQVPHYFINNQSVKDQYSVGAYEAEALSLLQELYREKEVVVLAGGSGLYINALCQGLDDFPAVSKEDRQYFEEKCTSEGIEALQDMLRSVDPDYAKKVDMQNPHRLIRALSVFRASGKAYSSFLDQKSLPRFFRPIYLQMNWERSALYERINHRVEKMVEAGLEAEVKALQPYRGHSALATVGYQEWWDYFAGNTDYPTTLALIKRNSRRYAKRQLTWMRRDGFWKHFSPKPLDDILGYCEWRMTNNYQLKTLRSASDLQLFYQKEDHKVAELLCSETGKIAIARAEIPTDKEALLSLLQEWTIRKENKTQYLFLPQPLELSTHQLGFEGANTLQKLPRPVLNKHDAGYSLYVREQKK